MITILGGTGNIGGKIADILIEKGGRTRLVARSADRLRARVNRRVRAMAGDARDTEFLAQAFSGSSSVFTLMPPNPTAENFHAYSDEIGKSIARAIELAGVSHVVNLSSIGADLDRGTGSVAALHRQEERLNRVPGLNVLHIRAAFFLENLLMNIEMIRSKNINGGAIRGDLKVPMIASRDVASFAAARLMLRDFEGASVQYLIGNDNLSMNEATMTIGIKIGRPNLRYVKFSYEEVEKGLIAAGVSPDVSRQYAGMIRAFNEGRIIVPGSPRTVMNTSFEEFCRSVFVPLFMAKKAA